MTPAQRLHRLRDTLLDLALRRWADDGWVAQPHLECAGAGRHEHPAVLAWVDDEEHVVHVHPHPAEKDQPVAKTLLQEVVGHVLLELGGSARDERAATALEDTLWPVLTPTQRQQLKNLVGPEASAP